ncbi:MAG: hypothetical protein Q7U99_02080 [Rubrivivax sp.]|nr:hypothetical protein [Rubrivivax sp.]
MRRSLLTLVTLAPLWLTGCDLLGIEPASVLAARREAESKAIGAGCRHAARSVEQCYALNKRADKAAIFAGWKEMSEYMAENKIEPVPPTAETAPTEVAAAEVTEAEGPVEKKPVKASTKKQ